MSSDDTLTARLVAAARIYPGHVAVQEPAGDGLTYRELDELSDLAQAHLQRLGVAPGDRVGICMPKTIDTLAAIIGALKAGAAYVPVDATAPSARTAYILHHCAVRVVVVDESLVETLSDELKKLGARPELLPVRGGAAGAGLRAALERDGASLITALPVPIAPDDLAYILYTSGSTGKPKGVMLSHRNAVSFVDWCASVFSPTPDDVFSSHAPLHFDLSILDLYVPLLNGARVVLIPSDLGKEPAGLAALIAHQRITVWYSTPSVLSLLTQYGKMDRHQYDALRIVLFAGEVFPVKHMRALQRFWPHPRYFNLYGPTETNVCTYYEVVGLVPEERTEPYPIGISCTHVHTRVVDADGVMVARGAEGELVVTGDGVMQGYWNLPDNTAGAFLVDEAGQRWYRTGDMVIEAEGGDYIFLGRRDRMVKRRGYRIELAEIESALYRHAAVKEAAVIAQCDRDGGVLIKAVLSCHDGQQPGVIDLKRFCAEALPLYMVPDQFAICPTIPKTSTDKIDYQRLAEAI